MYLETRAAVWIWYELLGPYQKTYEGCLRQFLIKHLSSTGDPAITCFSCSPSTDTDGTEIDMLQELTVGNE